MIPLCGPWTYLLMQKQMMLMVSAVWMVYWNGRLSTYSSGLGIISCMCLSSCLSDSRNVYSLLAAICQETPCYAAVVVRMTSEFILQAAYRAVAVC